jgi:hypothetical protein
VDKYVVTGGKIPGRLGCRLVDCGLITDEQLEHALIQQLRTHELLGQILIDYGYLHGDALLVFTQPLADEKNSAPEGELLSFAAENVDLNLLKLVPENEDDPVPEEDGNALYVYCRPVD